MLKFSTVVWALLAITAGSALFLMKYDVRALEDRLVSLDGEIARNRQAVHVLKAEWSFLNQPARLEDLGRRLLRLQPLDAARIGTIDDIPMLADGSQGGDGALSPPAQTAPPAADQTTPLLSGWNRKE